MAASTSIDTWQKVGQNSRKSARSKPPAQPLIKCPECGSKKIWKDGLRYVRSDSGGDIAIQRYICRECGRRFSEDTALGSRMGSNPTSRRDIHLFGSYSLPNRHGFNPSSRSKDRSPSGRDHLARELADGSARRMSCLGARVGKSPEVVSRAGPREGQVYTLSQKTRIEKRAAGATKLSKEEVKGKIIEFMWYLKKQGFAESTVKERTKTLKRLSKQIDITDPEAFKHLLASHDEWSNQYKLNMVNCYQHFVEMCELQWIPPNYKPVEKLPFIPQEQEIDALIAGCGQKVATSLQLLKETGMRIGEAWQLEWINIDGKRHTVTCTPEKGGKPRMFKVSDNLIAMLKALPKKSELVFGDTSLNCHRSNFTQQRKRLAKKLKNPRLKKITFHTLRHWKATMEYHKTKDILHVKQLLGHRRIENTMKYTHLVNFDNPEEFICRVAKTLEEAKELIEAGFEYVTEIDDSKLFRKRK